MNGSHVELRPVGFGVETPKIYRFWNACNFAGFRVLPYIILMVGRTFQNRRVSAISAYIGFIIFEIIPTYGAERPVCAIYHRADSEVFLH